MYFYVKGIFKVTRASYPTQVATTLFSFAFSLTLAKYRNILIGDINLLEEVTSGKTAQIQREYIEYTVTLRDASNINVARIYRSGDKARKVPMEITY